MKLHIFFTPTPILDVCGDKFKFKIYKLRLVWGFVALIFALAPFASHAEEVNLGNFSIDEIQKITGTPINFHVADKTVVADKTALAGWLKIRPALRTSANYSSEAENINFIPTDDPAAKIYFRFLDLERGRSHIRISTSLALDTDQLKSYLEKMKGDSRVEATDAKLSFTGGAVSAFSLSKDGYEIDTEKSFQDISKSLTENPLTKDITLETNALKPDVISTDLDKYGIKELIGEGVSNFLRSPQNRIHNIQVGAAKFNGVLIKPGEEFSFIKTLGPVDESTGYLPELVIKTDKTVPEFGGGMCQVSTTMFRAALNSGLRITARTNHAYPVVYYNPQGLDATVYIPNPDLKFVNDTPNHILVQTHIAGTQLFFDFYGTSDGRQTKIDGPTVLEKNPDGSMKTDVFQVVSDANGNLIRKSEFKSNYKSPSLFPHPGEEKITEKPADWSQKQWKAYKKANGV
ncbi:MAG: VanW family protein [Candidatus Moranbacteria bacterium]|nr:VanW family protein [Candidatus Moranbacteria bacterium]